MQAHGPGFRPSNHIRSIVHALTGVLALLLIQYALSPPAMIAAAFGFSVWGWGMEIGRRRSPAVNRFLMWVFGSIAHPHEHDHINSATWYCTALLALSLTASPMACSLAVIVLAIGDPAAALIGRRWGHLRLASGRSLEGALAFLVFASLAALATLRLFYPELALNETVAVALGAGAAGAIAELATARLDDNLVIPLAAAAGASLVATLFG